MGYKTVQVFPGRSTPDSFHIWLQASREIRKLTLCTVYPAPSFFISHCKLSDMCNKRRALAYEASSFFEIFGGTTAHFPRVYLNVEVCLGVNVLDLVDPWLQLSVFEDRGGVTGSVQGHGWQDECREQEPVTMPLSCTGSGPPPPHFRLVTWCLGVGRGTSKRFPCLIPSSHSW